MDVEDRYKVCQLLETMIAADGEITEGERAFFRKVVQRFGLPERETGPFSADSVGRTTTTLRSLAPEDRAGVMALLVEAAVVDGRVDPRERALLLAAAATLGIEATALEDRIAGRLRASSPPR